MGFMVVACLSFTCYIEVFLASEKTLPTSVVAFSGLTHAYATGILLIANVFSIIVIVVSTRDVKALASCI